MVWDSGSPFAAFCQKPVRILQKPPEEKAKEKVGSILERLQPRKTNMSPKKDYLNRKCIFQPSLFRGYVSFQRGMGSKAEDLLGGGNSNIFFHPEP